MQQKAPAIYDEQTTHGNRARDALWRDPRGLVVTVVVVGADAAVSHPVFCP